MEADFSIRNEVDSVRPANQDDEYTDYVLPESPFDEFITNHMESSPPPSSFQTNDSQYWAKQAYLNSKMVQNQQRLIHQQQVFNYSMMRSTLKSNQSNLWKWVALLALGIVFYVVVIKDREKAEPRKRRRHKRNRNMESSLIDEDEL